MSGLAKNRLRIFVHLFGFYISTFTFFAALLPVGLMEGSDELDCCIDTEGAEEGMALGAKSFSHSNDNGSTRVKRTVDPEISFRQSGMDTGGGTGFFLSFRKVVSGSTITVMFFAILVHAEAHIKLKLLSSRR
jgi:hypothetical protein